MELKKNNMNLTDKKWQIGAKWKKCNQIWIITDTTAGIMTLSSGNGKRKDIITHPSHVQQDFKYIENEIETLN